MAQHVPGSGQSSLEGLRGYSGGFAAEVRKLQQQMRERGEKLGELENKTESMNESAMKFSTNANAVSLYSGFT